MSYSDKDNFQGIYEKITEEAEKLYKKMGCLFKNFPGWEIGVITSHEKFQECFGKHAVMLKDLKAGNLETKFYMYSDKLGTKHQNSSKKPDDRKTTKR
mgnify:CR=1 FL=1